MARVQSVAHFISRYLFSIIAVTEWKQIRGNTHKHVYTSGNNEYTARAHTNRNKETVASE